MEGPDELELEMGELMDEPDEPDPLPGRIQEDVARMVSMWGKGRIRRFLEDVAEAYSHTDIEFTPGMSFREFE